MTATKPEGQEPKKPANDEAGSLAAVVLVGQLGFVIAGPIVACTLAAFYIERRFGGGAPVIVAGVLIGVASGVFGAYRLIKPYLD